MEPLIGQPASGGAGSGAGGALVRDVSLASFRADVVEASQEAVVLIDFWADWCGPCKQLTPTLEKVVPTYGGRVRLAKINVDKEQQLAGQFGIQSIPTVMAVVGGRPVNYFQGAIPEAQLRAFIDKSLAALGPAPDAPDIEAGLIQAAEALAHGDTASATEIYQAILEMEPGHAGATLGLASLKLALRDFKAAEVLLSTFDDQAQKLPEALQLKAALGLAQEYTLLPDREAVAAKLDANADDHDAMNALAGDAIARGDMDSAADFLLHSIRRDREWKGGAARQTLLKLFEAMGHDSPFTLANRRQLSSILFS